MKKQEFKDHIRRNVGSPMPDRGENLSDEMLDDLHEHMASSKKHLTAGEVTQNFHHKIDVHVPLRVRDDVSMLIDKMWNRFIKTDLVIARRDNDLNAGGFKTVIATTLIQMGEFIPLNPNRSLGGDFNYKDHGQIIAVLGVKDTTWETFDGTESPNAVHSGLKGTALFEDGSTRDMRLVADAGTLMRVLSSVGDMLQND